MFQRADFGVQLSQVLVGWFQKPSPHTAGLWFVKALVSAAGGDSLHRCVAIHNNCCIIPSLSGKHNGAVWDYDPPKAA